MSARRGHGPLRDDALRELGLQIATRLIAALRTGRAYAIDNPVFVSQLEQLLEVIVPVLEASGEARLTNVDGDLHLNGVALPLRASSARFTEQLSNELRVRVIAGLSFQKGLAVPELELFMRYFLPSEVYKGHDLARACQSQGIRHAQPLLGLEKTPLVVQAAPEAPDHLHDALAACTRAVHDAHWMLGTGRPQGIASHRYKRVVAPLVDAALAGRPLSAGLADLDHAGADRWLRGTHICLLAVMVGASLGLGRAMLAELGAAALLHGTDGEELPVDDAKAGDPVSRALLRRARLTPLDPAVMASLRAVLPAASDAGGRSDESPLADILRIADAYVALASQRTGSVTRRTPHEALGLVLGPLGSRFHPALRAALVRSLGLHPPGQIVELDDGAVARVSAADPRDPERPLIERITGPSAERLAPEARGAVVPLPEGRHIARAVPFARRAAGDEGGFQRRRKPDRRQSRG